MVKYVRMFVCSALCLGVVHSVSAQDVKQGGYHFTSIKEINTTSVKDQDRSSTCWSFSTLGLLESEILRLGNPAIDLSPMFVVRCIYSEKADRYARFQGSISISGGGSSADVIRAIRRYGIVPMEVYQGLRYGTDSHVHGELDAVAEAFIGAVVKNPNRKLSTAWKKGFDGILDAYLGDVSSSFTYRGKEYTPKSFAQSLGINVDDYVEITSFTHHPFYTRFIIEIPDNWAHDEVYNVPLSDLGDIVDYAVDNGYSIAWGSDVSDSGINWTEGVAIVPDLDSEELAGSDMAKWTAKKPKEKYAKAFEKPGSEIAITQEMRQLAFDNYQTTDDHGMVIVGKAKDQNGNLYYKVKNSWGDDGRFNGYFYASKPFVLYKTITIMLHKDAIPQDIRAKLGI